MTPKLALTGTTICTIKAKAKPYKLGDHLGFHFDYHGFSASPLPHRASRILQ